MTIRALVFQHRRLAIPIIVAIGATNWLLQFPVQRPLLAATYAISIALVLWRPIVLFGVVPAALPILDLAPWSGRHYVDEFDMLLLLTCTAAWARRPSRAAPPLDRRTVVIGTGILLILVIGIVRALSAWPGLQASGFEYPLGEFNALRIGKGGVWALLVFLLARTWMASGNDVQEPFAIGMIVGLFCVVICVAVERMAFTGLTNVASDYRVSGPFSAMSLGGAYVEGFLVVATPFLILKLLPPVRPAQLLCGVLLLAGTVYALAVTFSRGGYAGMALGMLVLGYMLGAAHGDDRRKRVLVLACLAALVVAVAYPVLSGGFALSRLKATGSDLAVRERHWSESLQSMDRSLVGQTFGMGLGSYPSVRFWDLPPDRRAGAHQLLIDDGGVPVLRLGAGKSYFLEQVVPIRAGERYRLELLVQRSDASKGPSWAICQKWIIASFDCGKPEAPLTVEQLPGGLSLKISQTIIAPASGKGLLSRPHRLSLSNAGHLAIDIASVSLMTENGDELIRNGRFEAGLDHWTVTSDDHLAWHIKSMPLGLYFELGVVGVIGATFLLISSLRRAAAAAFAGQRLGAAVLSALCAFFAVGIFDTLIDSPRFLMLWLLLCLWAQLLSPPGALGQTSALKRPR